MQDDKVVSYPNNIETRVALVEMSIININQTLIRLETKIDNGFIEIDKNFKEIRKESIADFRWLITVITGLSAVMAHGFHWF